MSLTYNESYDRPAEPQLVRNDFAELASLADPAELRPLGRFAPSQ